jgi:hypothetical protein
VENIAPATLARKPIQGFEWIVRTIQRGNKRSGFRTHGSLQMTANMSARLAITIDSPGGWCRFGGPIESEGLILPRRFRMAIQAHLVELERKHKSLENELHEALVHLSTDDLQIVELKRRKLMVKDQIERLKHSTETLH